MIRSRHTIQVQAVFSLYDILTGRQVQAENVRFFLPEGGKMIWKEGGYFVLIGCRDQEITLTIESLFYEKVELFKKLGMEEMGTDRVWLSPGRAYPNSRQFPYVEGRAAPCAKVRVMPVDPKKGIRLLKDYTAKTKETGLLVFQGGRVDLEGRQVAAVTAKSHGWKAEFTVAQGMDEKSGLFHVQKPFSGDLKKAETFICPVFLKQADSDGNYRLLLPKEAAQAKVCLICWEIDGKTEIQETEIRIQE